MCDMEVETFRSERENTIIFGIKSTMAVMKVMKNAQCNVIC